MKIVNEKYDGEWFVEAHLNDRDIDRLKKDGQLLAKDVFGSEIFSFAIIYECDKTAPLDPENIKEKKIRYRR